MKANTLLTCWLFNLKSTVGGVRRQNYKTFRKYVQRFLGLPVILRHCVTYFFHSTDDNMNLAAGGYRISFW